MIYFKLVIIVGLSFFWGLTFANDRRVNLPNLQVFIEKQGDDIYFGADEQTDPSQVMDFRNKVDEIDGETFVFMTGTLCGKDKNGVYFIYNEGVYSAYDVNPQTFVPLSSVCEYVRDDKIVKMMTNDQYIMQEITKSNLSSYSGNKYHLFWMGMDDKYMYFSTTNNTGYVKDSIIKQYYDDIKPLFIEKIYNKYDKIRVYKALGNIQSEALYKTKDLEILGVSSALIDTFFPYGIYPENH